MSRLIYKIIQIFQNIVIIILLFYVLLYGNSATNFEYRLMIYMTFHIQLLKYVTIMEGMMWHVVGQNNFTHGTLGHAIKHG